MSGEKADGLAARLIDPVGNSSHTENDDDDEEHNRESTVYAADAVYIAPQPTSIKKAESKKPSAPPTPSAPPAAQTSSKKKAPVATTAAIATAVNSPPPIAASSEPPAELLCPLTGKVMSDPVICSDGHTYERMAIEQHFQSQIDLQHQLSGDASSPTVVTSPLTKQRLDSAALIPNRAVQNMVAKFHASQER
jgi:hypothetical protein